MAGPHGSRRPPWAWGVGVLVLTALLASAGWMLVGEQRVAARLAPAPPAAAGGGAGASAPAPPLQRPESQLAAPSSGPTVRGVVRLPGGEPAASATVTVERAVTSWPELQTEPLDQARAITGVDGAFQFRVDDAHGLVVRFDHPQLVGGVVEVPRHGEPLELRLEPAFELYGYVTTPAGTPVANARVAVESVPGDNRRVEARTTGGDGRYLFAKLAPGPVRVVARHDAWQPTAQPAVVVGDQRLVSLAFARPAQPPLRGRVVSAVTQQPVAGALVQLLPLNGKLGLVDPFSVRTGADGAFQIAGLARGSMRLVVRHVDHGAVMTTQTVGIAAAEPTIELPRRCLLSGRLTADGRPPWRGGERLLLRDAAGQLATTTLEADGTFRFAAAVSPGWANLRCDAPDLVFQRSYTADVDVRVDESITVEFDLPVVAPAVLRGRLVDAADRPLAGASLVRTKLLAEGARTITDAAVQFDLGMVGSQFAQLFASDRDELVATTDKAGGFTIRGLAPGPVLLRTLAPGHGSRLVRQTVGEVGSVADLGTIRLPRGRSLQGRVVRRDALGGERGFAGATVTVVGTETQASTVTGAEGRWRVDDLVPGEYRVRARLATQPAGSSVRTERVDATGPTPHVVIVLDTGRTVRGEVLGSDNQAVPGAIVSVVGVAGASTVSDANGDFALELPERANRLQVALADRSSVVTVAVPAGDQRLSVKLDTPPTCTIVATVAGLPGRKLLPSAVLRLAPAGTEPEAARSRWLELPDGQLEWALCPTGRVRIEVWCEGYVPAVIDDRELAANVRHELGDLLLEPGCHLAGVVRTNGGAPIQGAEVLVGDEGDLALFAPQVRTDADGAFLIRGISSRSSRLVVRAGGFAVRTIDLQLPRDALAEEPYAITLLPGATIEVALGDAAARESAVVELRRGGRVVATADLGDDGRAVFPHRSAGAYTVQLGGGTGEPRVVEVGPGDTLVRVQLP